MTKVKMIITAFLVFGLTLGMASMASAVSITCGQCHGVTNGPDNGDNCTNNARGLHGTHVNYSSATYKKTVLNNGKCSYCHSAVSDTKGIASATHNNNYMNITGNVVNTLDTRNLRETAKTCTYACHKNAAATAPWGNFTTSNIKLSCVACHGDSSNSAGLTGAHAAHMLNNVTTPGSYGLMNLANNAGCKNCHPDQVNDFWTAANRLDNGTRKAYPHAADGTNVQAANATMAGNVSAITGGVGNTATCTNACHPRSSTIQWNGALDCNMCHYYGSPTLDTNNTGTGALSVGHNVHFKVGNQYACTECHPVRSDAVHATRLPVQSYNANLGSATRPSMTYDKVAKTCTNTGGLCHGLGTTPVFGTVGAGCGACHYYPGAPARDWAAGGGNGHLVRYNTTVTNKHMRENAYFHYSSASETFASVIADVNKCGLCHRNVKIHKNGTNFAHLSSATGSTYSQCGTTPFTFSSGGVGNDNNVTCNNVKCHSGKQTPIWK